MKFTNGRSAMYVIIIIHNSIKFNYDNPGVKITMYLSSSPSIQTYFDVYFIIHLGIRQQWDFILPLFWKEKVLKRPEVKGTKKNL